WARALAPKTAPVTRNRATIETPRLRAMRCLASIRFTVSRIRDGSFRPSATLRHAIAERFQASGHRRQRWSSAGGRLARVHRIGLLATLRRAGRPLVHRPESLLHSRVATLVARPSLALDDDGPEPCRLEGGSERVEIADEDDRRVIGANVRRACRLDRLDRDRLDAGPVA